MTATSLTSSATLSLSLGSTVLPSTTSALNLPSVTPFQTSTPSDASIQFPTLAAIGTLVTAGLAIIML
ncbi:hypothetical protein BGW37DRAFT_474588 [Umbelopsis sp. PMI_123]|nr:hypothetical protein BGW37DRAFT_474588 [Umbelopsis sp. PMI_123]